MKIKIRRMIEQRSERRKNIGRKIKALREENGISIQRIADSLDMGEKNYIRIEEGKFSTVKEILKAYFSAIGLLIAKTEKDDFIKRIISEEVTDEQTED